MSGTQEVEDFTKDDIQELLKGKFGQGVSVIDFMCQHATVAGDNYGSTLLSLDVNILDNNASQTLQLIAKLVPPTDFLRELFDVTVTFRKEINFYKLVSPAFLEMQSECGFQEHEMIHLVPPYYGARTTWDVPGNESARFDAVLLIGNLKVLDYQVADRLSGLDLKHSECAMRNLALFHALGIALREKKPITFKETVLKATLPCHIGEKNIDEIQNRKDFIQTLGKNVPECLPYVEKIEKCVLSHFNFENVSLVREPFASLVHNDFWTNNMMFKYKDSQSSIPCDIKMLDFQLTLFCSPARDIIFFLYGSVQKQVLENYFDHLINMYYENLVSLLKKLKCNVQNFTKSAFLEEINTFAPTQLYHILFMTTVIYAQKDNTEELHELTSTEHMMEVGSSALGRKKVHDVVNDFDRRGWIRETCEL